MAVFLFVQLLAQSGHPSLHRTCPLSGAKRTCLFALQMSAYDPKRTSARYSPLIEPRGFTVMIAHLSVCPALATLSSMLVGEICIVVVLIILQWLARDV